MFRVLGDNDLQVFYRWTEEPACCIMPLSMSCWQVGHRLAKGSPDSGGGGGSTRRQQRHPSCGIDTHGPASCIVDMRYSASITARSLKVAESRVVADLILHGISGKA